MSKRAVRLANDLPDIFGEFYIRVPDEYLPDPVTYCLRWRFFHQLTKLNTRPLLELRQKVFGSGANCLNWPVYEEGTEGDARAAFLSLGQAFSSSAWATENLLSIVKDWAESKNLRSGFIVEMALKLVLLWSRAVNEKERSSAALPSYVLEIAMPPLGYLQGDARYQRLQEALQEQFEEETALLMWSPTGRDDRVDFYKHYLKRARSLAELHGLERVPNIRAADRHLLWLAAMNAEELNQGDVNKRYGGKGKVPSTIWEGIRNAGKLIGLDPRELPLGRPNGS